MSHAYGNAPQRPVSEQSTGELVQHASEQLVRLVREELELARAELTEKGRHAGLGAGLFGGGGLLALYGLGVLLIAAVLGLAVVMPAWLAALIVAVVLLVVAAVMALLGRRQVKQAVPPMPEEAAESVRADLDTVTAAVRDRGSVESGNNATGRAVEVVGTARGARRTGGARVVREGRR